MEKTIINPQYIVNKVFNNKAEIYALAALLVFISHGVPIPGGRMCHKLGEIGVDFFFFLGAITCAASWDKTPIYRIFYGKRLLRVYVPLLVFLFTVYIVSHILGEYMVYKYHIILTASVLGALVYNDVWCWFVPTVLVFYFFTPFYLKLSRKIPAIMLLPFAIIAADILLDVKDLKMPFFMVWNRTPIYLLGLNIYVMSKMKNPDFFRKVWIDAAGVLAIVLTLLLRYFDLLDLHRLRYIFIIIVFFVVCNFNINGKYAWINYIGQLSLEIYLVQEYIFKLMILIPDNRIAFALMPVAFVVCILMAWTLSKLIKFIINALRLTKHVNK